MDFAQAFRLAITLFFVAIFLGCDSRTVAVYQASEAVRAMGADAENDEEKALWRELREQVKIELAKHCGSPRTPKMLGDEEIDVAHLRRGSAVYARHCEACHGVSGDGNGQVAEYLSPRPRDYRRGIFKFTSMPYGAKPRRSDLMRTVQRGVTGTSMPSFDTLYPDDLEAVVDYVLVLTHRGELEGELVLLAEDEEEINPEYMDEIIEELLNRWDADPGTTVQPVSTMPPMTEASVRAGHKLFLKHACNKCHGKDGRGGSKGGVEIGNDAWGNSAAAADLTSGMFRGGPRPLDIYRRIHAGINGTPMPSFAAMFANNPEQVWQLVHFIEDLGQRRRRGLEPIGASEIAQIEQEIAAEAAEAQPSEESAAEEPAEPDTEEVEPAGEETELQEAA